MLPAAAIGLLALAGCSAASPAAAPAPRGANSASPVAAAGTAEVVGGIQRIQILANDSFRFAPSTVRVHTGKVEITLVDSGAYPHNIVIPALGIQSASVTGDPGGQRVTFSATFPHPGRYRFYCVYHQSAGMVGTFVVVS